MKSTMLGCFLAFLMIAVLPAQDIKFTSPAAGESWTLGSSRTVSWTFQGIPAGTMVVLKLFRGADLKGILAKNVAIGTNGSGSWTWANVGAFTNGQAGAGSDYHIRIRDQKGAYPGAISGSFSLAEAGSGLKGVVSRRAGSPFLALNSIQVTMPVQGLQAKPGDPLRIQWDRAPIASYSHVRFGVYASDRKTYVGPVHMSDSEPKPNTGDYQDAYVLPARYETGREYAIRVATPDDKYFGFSGIFRILPLELVQETKTFSGSSSLHYVLTEQSKWPGCLYTKGEGPSWPAIGYPVGWSTVSDDPAGPCWKFMNHIYRTLVNPAGILQGAQVTKAVLRFSVMQGVKQTLTVLRRDGPGEALDVAATPVATVPNWGFGKDIEVDVTAVVRDWCSGKAAIRGLIIRGGNEGYSKTVMNAQCAITAPELIVTFLEKK